MPLMSELSEATIVPKLVPQDAINRIAAVSAYGITPENVDRFAGSLDDPMRAITALPGVVAE